MLLGSIKKGFSAANRSLTLIAPLWGVGFFWNLVNVFAPASKPQLQPRASSLALTVVLGAALIAITIFLQAGTLTYVRDQVKTGRAAWPVFFSGARRYFLPMLFLGFLVAAGLGLVFAVSGLAVLFLQEVGILIALPLMAIGIYLALLLFMAPYIIVLEGPSFPQAVRESVAFTRKNILDAVKILAVLALLAIAPALLLAAAGSFLTVEFPGRFSQILFIGINSLSKAYGGVFVTGVFIDFYLVRNAGGAR